MADPSSQAPPPSYDELFNKPGDGSAPSAPPPPPGQYPGQYPAPAVSQTPYPGYPAAQTQPYGQPASQSYGTAPLQPPYPQGTTAGATYLPAQPHPAYGPTGPVAVPTQPYRDLYAPSGQPGQYTYNTVTATTTNNAGYNTTPLVVSGAQVSPVAGNRQRKIVLGVVVFLITFVVCIVIMTTMFRG
ncbi:calcium-binding protein P isoform X1 [Aplysia californica]|uniref:Calcium-binding protein P isoform X1 n=1 Tax=Aplysia californica TaxID=6500 RepID=A0ABM0JFX6_APLCA|nr:calcium-binding protein P isoform X1 [Aplysia californica]